MTHPFDIAVFIGRFQPFHDGHLHVIRQALTHARQVVVLVGSSRQAPSYRNPWSFAERQTMLRACLDDQDNARVFTYPLQDAPYNEVAWICGAQAAVYVHLQQQRLAAERTRIALIGHAKDHSSYYLKLFPNWASIAVDNLTGLNATALRAAFFQSDLSLCGIPAPTLAWLDTYRRTPAYTALRDEVAFIEAYRSGWRDSPYPPTFMTVDAVVVQSGHILLVRRLARPGKGLLALPGGFVQPHETLEQAMLRELREETGLKVPLPVLQGAIKRREVFDAPYRSDRGRTITQAFLLRLQDELQLPKVKGGTDADKAFWLPVGLLQPEEFFEDHYFLIQHLIGE